MSSSGTVHYYSELASPSAIDLGRVLAYLDARSAEYVMLASPSDDEYTRFLNGDDESSYHVVARNVPASDLRSTIESHHVAGSCIQLYLNGSPVADRLRKAVIDGVAPAIRGRFVPTQAVLSIGPHDIFTTTDTAPDQFLIHAAVSVAFHGYHTPSDWGEAEQQILQLPAAVGIRNDLAAFFPDVGAKAYWDL